MKYGDAMFFTHTCLQCGHEWMVSLSEVSLYCPKCNSNLWNFRNHIEINKFDGKTNVSTKNNIKQSKEQQSISFKQRKELFLKNTISTNKNSMNKYKRVAESTIRYPGGKTLGVGHIVELLPDTISRVVSPFYGGGSVEIAIAKHLGIEVIGYDIFDILMNYWNYQIHKPEILYEGLSNMVPKKQFFEEIRMKLRAFWDGEQDYTQEELAIDFLYNYNLSYGPGFMGWSSKIYLNKRKYDAMCNRVKEFRPGNLKVGCASFEEVFKAYPNDFFYCDPPYYIGEDSKMFKGIYPMRNIPIHHKDFKHEHLSKLLKKHKGGWILSYNDCPTIRDYYQNFEHIFPTWQYTMGQGETRIGKNRIQDGNDHVKKSHEILIFKPPEI